LAISPTKTLRVHPYCQTNGPNKRRRTCLDSQRKDTPQHPCITNGTQYRQPSTARQSPRHTASAPRRTAGSNSRAFGSTGTGWRLYTISQGDMPKKSASMPSTAVVSQAHSATNAGGGHSHASAAWTQKCQALHHTIGCGMTSNGVHVLNGPASQQMHKLCSQFVPLSDVM
jgi:hypothetical protein